MFATLGRFWSLAFGLLALLPLGSAEAQSPAIEAALSSGEFAPALALAAKLPSPEQDAAQKKIAAAQATVDRRAALETALLIESDTLRAAELQRLRQPVLAGAAGGTEADFESLINLVTNTVQPPTWKVNGGPGDVFGFEGGVYCDPDGTLQRRLQTDPQRDWNKLREWAKPTGAPQMVRTASPLRKISLRRLERFVQATLARGESLPEEVRYLAGLHRLQFVLSYVEHGDIVIAGPADDWRHDEQGLALSAKSGAPVLQLDDLIVVLRHGLTSNDGVFGCSITPTRERLAAVQEFLARTTATPLKPGERNRWVDELRDTLGKQKIQVNGLDPHSRAALVLVEADYRMKLVGVGLEPAVPGVQNYLDAIHVKPNEPLPELDVLRWWFAMNYDAIRCSPDRTAFELLGPGVKVLSENELLRRDGEREHTGQASAANRAFTESFTKHFPELAIKYPIYAELRNLFDLALLSSLIRSHDWPQQYAWSLSTFGPDGWYHPRQAIAPQGVESVLRLRMVDQRRFIVGVSGGVRAEPRQYTAPSALQVDSSKRLTTGKEYHNRSRPADESAWWWD